jgi:putative membrane protein
VIAALFFLIEKSSMYLQNPFDNTPTDTPVTEIAFTIETNLKKMLSEAKLPVKVQTEGYYVM